MSTDESKALVRRYAEIFNQKNLDAADTIVALDYMAHFPGAPEPVRGREAWKQLAADFFASFPDLEVTIEDMVAEGDTVVSRMTNRGTHKSEWLGVPATGRQVTWTAMAINRIADGKLVEQWVNDDALGVMQQLGVMPPAGQRS